MTKKKTANKVFTAAVDMSAFFNATLRVIAPNEDAARELVEEHLDEIGRKLDDMVSALVSPDDTATQAYWEQKTKQGEGLPGNLEVISAYVTLDDTNGNPEVTDVTEEE